MEALGYIFMYFLQGEDNQEICLLRFRNCYTRTIYLY